jgi:hypothetical protein
MNIIVSAVEGLVSQLVDKNISCSCKGVGPEDDQFANIVNTGIKWLISNNDMFKKSAIHNRRRAKFGFGWYKVVFNEGYAGGFGLSEILVPPVNKVFVDSNITDVTRIQDAMFIAETMVYSKQVMIDLYGYDKAHSVDYGPNQFSDNGVFEEAFTAMTNEFSTVVIQWWSRYEGYLRLQEFSACGLLLFDSCKDGTRKDNQKGLEIKARPYYKYVENKYPYFYTGKYHVEGRLHGFGDAFLLLPLQKAINEIYDKIRIQMRPNLMAIDSYADINIEEFNDNSFEPVEFDGGQLMGRQPVYNIPWGAINNEMFALIERVHTEAQRVIRFSNTMIGQGDAQTATEAAIQQEQGNSHISHDKVLHEQTLNDVFKYAIQLMMEFSKTGKALSIGDDEKEYDWVDFRNFANIPAQIPATEGFTKEFLSKNPNAKPPKYEALQEGDKVVTKPIELDVYISMGSGLPKNPAFVWNMIEKLSQLMVLDTDEAPPAPKPAISWVELRDFLKNILGIPIKTDDQMKKFVEQMKAVQAAQLQKNMKSGIPPTGPSPMGAETPGGPGGNQPEEQPGTMGMTAGSAENMQANPAVTQGGM